MKISIRGTDTRRVSVRFTGRVGVKVRDGLK